MPTNARISSLLEAELAALREDLARCRSGAAAEQRAAAELREQNAYLSALRETTFALIDRLDLDDILSATITRAAALLNTDHGYIYLLDDESDGMSLRIGVGVFGDALGRQIKRGIGVSGTVWDAGTPMTVNDYSNWPGRDAAFDNQRHYAVVGVPLTADGGVIGVLGLSYTEPDRQFDGAAIDRLVQFAQLASLAIDNARLYTAAQRHVRELTLLDQVRTAVARELELTVLFRTVVESIKQQFGYGLVSIYLREGEQLRLQSQVGYHQVLDYIPVSQGVMGRVVRTGVPAVVEDEASDPSVIWAFEGISSEVCVPLYDTGQVVGVLNLESTLRLGHADLRLMLALSEHINVAIGRARMYAQALENEQRYRVVIDNVKEGIFQIDLAGQLRLLNPAWSTITGRAVADCIGSPLLEHVHPADRAWVGVALVAAAAPAGLDIHREVRLLTGDGQFRWVELYARRVLDAQGLVAGMLGTLDDITDRRQAEATITQMAYYDTLTGLPNRALFHQRLQVALNRGPAPQYRVALLFLDLDRFKVINDTLGHSIGDQLLQAVAQRLIGCVREHDTVARMGGDEFTVILPNVPATADVTDVAHRILTALMPPFTIGGHDLFVTASIGISMYPVDGDDMNTLLQQADTAMYRAKERARNTFQFYTPAMNATALARLELEQQLRHAIERNELEIYYQPRVETWSGEITGAEALVRWQHPERGLVAPGEFIPLAEETGLIVPLGAWVLRTACAQTRAWQAAGAPWMRIAVNLSAQQFQQADLAEQVAAVLAETGLDASCLELEITESMTMLHVERSMAMLAALKAMGLQLAIDDFGTGYSSLSYLKRFPIDRLKIDKSFVRDLSTNANDAAIADAIIALAHSLKLAVTAEGVETPAQLAFLRAHGCDEIQGFLASPAVPGARFGALLSERVLLQAPAPLPMPV